MNWVCLLILLATILSNIASDNDVPTINVTCEYSRDGDSNICAIRNVDYRLSQPSNLIVLNDDAFNDLDFVRITNRCRTIPLNIFQLFPKLKNLLIKTGLQKLSKEHFIGGNELNVLQLPRNSMSTIEAHTFDGMDKLEKMDLSRNLLTKLESNTFTGAINLKELDLSSNRINTIEDGAFNIRTLESIDFAHNNLRSLSDDVFVGCSDLETLYLISNDLTRIGKSFDNLQELRALQLHCDRVKIMDLDFYAIARKPHLAYLHFSYVGLILVDPPSAANDNYTAYHLSILGNTWNRLRNFRNLTTLDLSYNDFTTINEIENILGMFPKLETFAFHANPCQGEVMQRLRTKFGDKLKSQYPLRVGIINFK